MNWYRLQRRTGLWSLRHALARLLLPERGPEIRSNEDGTTDEVVGYGFLHVEQMDKGLYWARLDTLEGRDIVMWFSSGKCKLKLRAEWE